MNTVEMTVQHSLASLLDSHMKRASIGDARLANQVNSINGNSYFIHRSTVRNWRTGSAQKVNSWRQLATVAVALGLDETEANRLLQSGGCPSIQALTATAKEADQALLAHWQNTPAQLAELTASTASTGNTEHDSLALPDVGENEIRKRNTTQPETNVWNFIAAKKWVGACVVAAFGLLSFGYFQFQSNNKNLLVNSNFDDGPVGWISFVHDTAAAHFKVVEGAMQIQIDQAAKTNWHIALNQKDLAVTAGKTYTVRFRVRGDGVTSMHVDITRVSEPRTSLSFDSSVRQMVTTTKDWATRTIEYEAIESVSAQDGGARLFFMFGKSEEGWIELDDIEFIEGKIEPDKPMPQS